MGVIKKLPNFSISEFYKEHRNGFINWAINQFGITEADACDLYQEASIDFFIAFQEGKLMDLSVLPKTYLYSIAKYKLLNKKRKLKNVVNLSLEDGINIYGEPGDTGMDEKKLPEELRNLLESHLNNLNDKEQEILRLYYHEDKSMQEIAEMLGYKNANVAKKMKFNSLNKLTSILKDKLSSIML